MKRLAILRNLTLFALFASLISSCTKELSPIGMGLLSDQDLLSMGYTDTIQITAYSIPEDSVYTHNLTLAQVGSMYDPIFGRTTVNYYSQIFLSTASTRFGTNPGLDSAFLYLPYSGSYGDTLSNMTFHVYMLKEALDSTHTYSNSKVAYDSEHPIGSITFQPRPHDTTIFDGVKLSAMLRIPINSIFADSIFSITDTNYLYSNAGFVKAFKGICIVAEPQNTPGKGAILTFNIPSTDTRLKIYYHNDTEDSLSYSFAITDKCSRYQSYDHYGYNEAIPLLKQQLAGDTTLGKQFLFAQGLAGIKIKLKFPNLSKWADPKNIVINDAQLILGNASTSETFTFPSYLSLRGVGEAGTTSPYSLVDETERSSYYDGYYYAAGNTFRFRITRYMQQVILGKISDRGLHLILPSSYVGNRLVLNGTSSPQADLKLLIRYTKIK